MRGILLATACVIGLATNSLAESSCLDSYQQGYADWQRFNHWQLSFIGDNHSDDSLSHAMIEGSQSGVNIATDCINRSDLKEHCDYVKRLCNRLDFSQKWRDT